MNSDIKLLKDLAKQVMDITKEDIENKKRQSWRGLHDLKLTKPLVHIRMYMCFKEEIWSLECIDPVYRECELKLKHKIYHKMMADDTVIEPWLSISGIHKTNYDCRWGAKAVLGKSTKEGYRPYQPTLLEIEDIDKLLLPKHEIDQEKTNFKYNKALDAIGDIIPIDISRAPIFSDMTGNISKDIAFLVGLEQLMWYMYDRPEWLHQILAFMRDGILKTQLEAETQGHWSASDSSNQGVPYASELAEPIPNTTAQRKDIWGFFASQEYTSVSPSLFNEFMLEYQIPIMNKFGLTAYGCCEDLTRKIDLLRKVKNLRRIAVAPEANVRKCAEQIQNDYVISWRPNPALMICCGFDEELIKKHIKENIKILKENNCVYEISLKDIATVRNKPENLIRWCEIVNQTIDDVYN